MKKEDRAFLFLLIFIVCLIPIAIWIIKDDIAKGGYNYLTRAEYWEYVREMNGGR